MNWKKYFNSVILKRGFEYYTAGHVGKIQYDKTDEEYYAPVRGNSSFDYFVYLSDEVVKNQNSDNLFLDISCSCPHAEDGNMCKHMAAFLYKMEEDGFIKKTPKEVQNNQRERLMSGSIFKDDTKNQSAFRPFKNSASNNDDKLIGYKKQYSFFDLDYMTRDMKITMGRYNEAKELVDSGKMSDFRFIKNFRNSGMYIRGHINDRMYGIQANTSEGGYGWGPRVWLVFDDEKIHEVNCNVYNCREHNYSSDQSKRFRPDNSMCKHTLALLIMFNNYIKSNKSKLDATSESGSRLIKAFGRAKTLSTEVEEITKSENVRLVPEIHNGEKLRLEFKIGDKRLYKLKSIDELVTEYEKDGNLKLGKKSEIDFRIQDFDQESKKIYSLIKKINNEDSERAQYSQDRYSYYSVSSKDIEKGTLALYGRNLDGFYKMYKDRDVLYIKDFYRKTGESYLHFKDSTYRLKLDLRKIINQRGEFEGVSIVPAQITLFNGSEYSYFIDEKNNFVRISEENKKAIEPFVIEAGDRYEFEESPMIIGRNNLASLYYDILPQVEEYIDVEESDSSEIREYLPPRPDFVFYLDAVDDEIQCQIRCRYDEEEFIMQLDEQLNLIIDGYRDRVSENEILNVAKEIFSKYRVSDKLFVCDKDSDIVFDILTNGVRKLMLYGEVQTTDRFNNLKLKKNWKVTVGVSIKSDLMNLSLISDDIPISELSDIMKSYKLKKKYHRLKNGDFISMDEEALITLNEMLENLQLSPKEFIKKNGNIRVPLYRALYLDKMLEEHDSIASERDKTFKNLIRAFKTTKDADYEVPECLKNTLRKYQRNGFRWLMTLDNYGFGGILADEMGLGKTIQVISLLQSRKEAGKLGTSLVVCPSSLVYNWLDEIQKFAPDLNAVAVAGNKTVREEIVRNVFDENNESKIDIMVTSYDLLKRDIDIYSDTSFDYEIIDEAQYIKNSSTAATKSVKIINSKHRLALTGTPIENRLSELWSIFDYLMPGYLYTYERFRKDFENDIVSAGDEERSRQLRRMVAPFIMRRLKKDVLKDLPEKIEETRVAVFEEEQQKLYDAQVLKLKDMLDESDEESIKKKKIQVLAEITKLRQICCDPTLIYDNYKSQSAKLDSLIELLQDATDCGHRCLVFSQFTSMFEIIEPKLRSLGMEYYKITGSTPKEERLKLVKAFNEGNVPVFLISLKAGGTGLNLVGADVVIHYDPWWNVAVQNQATDRAHRIGQEKIVTVYKLIAKGTIEEKIVKLQESKKELAEEILKGETGNIGSLSKEELMELISI